MQDAGCCAWLSLRTALALGSAAYEHCSAIRLSSEPLQSGERIHSLDDLQDIDELHVLEVRHLPPQGEASV